MLALRERRPYAATGMDAARSPNSSSRAAVKRAPAGPRLTERLRGEIHGAALDFVVERYELTPAQREQLASIPIRWRRSRGGSAYYQRAARGFDGPHILLRVAPAAVGKWHTYRRARARFSTPSGGIELEAMLLAKAVLVHEFTHALQHGACGHARRSFSEVETTENEIEFIRRHAPEAFAQLTPVVRRAPRRKVRRAPAPPSGLAVLRAIVLRAAGTLAGLIQPAKPAAHGPRSSRPRARSPTPTGN